MIQLIDQPSNCQGDTMKEIMDHQKACAYFLLAKEQRLGLLQLQAHSRKDEFKIPDGCPSKYHESLQILPTLLQIIYENPISSCNDYQDMIFELQTCQFPLASAGTK